MPRAKPQPPPLSASIWHNRVVGYAEVPVSTLLANDRNWRRHPPLQTDALAGVLREVGIVQNLLVNKRTSPQWPDDQRGQDVLIDGHARTALALQQGQTTLPVTYVDLTPAEEAEILVSFDPLGALAEANTEALAGLLREVSSGESAVQQLLAQLAEQAGLMPGVGADDAPGGENDVMHQSLADRFGVPPFSVLDARQGYWQDRKRAWLALGIQSELGRGSDIGAIPPNEAALPERRFAGVHQYSAAATIKRQGGTIGSDGSQVYKQRSQNTGVGADKNGLLGFSANVRSHYKGGGKPGRQSPTRDEA